MHHRIVASAAALILAAGLPQLSAAEDPRAREMPPVVAAFEIETRGAPLSPAVLARLTIYLGSGLSESGMYEVVPQDQLKQALTSKRKESYRQCYAQSCQIEIGKEVAAGKALSTQVMKVGTRCMVVSNLYDLKKGTSGKAARAVGSCDEDGITTSIDAVVAKLTSKPAAAAPAPAASPAPAAAKPAPAPAPAPPVEKHIPPSMTLTKAVRLYDKDDFSGARAAFAKVARGETGDDASNVQRAEFYLGKTEYRLKDYHAALKHFKHIVAAGRAHRYFEAIPKWLVALKQQLPASAGVAEVIARHKQAKP